MYDNDKKQDTYKIGPLFSKCKDRIEPAHSESIFFCYKALVQVKVHTNGFVQERMNNVICFLYKPKVIINKSSGEVSLVEQDTIECIS